MHPWLWLFGDHLSAWCLCNEERGAFNYCWVSLRSPWSLGEGDCSVITGLLGLGTEVFHQTLDIWLCPTERRCFKTKAHTVPAILLHRILRNLLFFRLIKDKKEGDKLQVQEDKLSMEVRYNQETEGIGLKNGLKKGKDDKDSQGSLSKSFLKEQQDSFSPSGTVDNCEKNRGSTGDPDYCRRILVRGKACGLPGSCCFPFELVVLKDYID